MKPKWKDVPEGYDWKAQDRNGDSFCFKHPPIRDDYGWVGVAGEDRWISKGSANPNWRDTLEQRPDETYITREDVLKVRDMINNNPLYPYYRQSIEALFTGGNEMNNCPRTRELTPIERIHAKGDSLKLEITMLNGRLAELDNIEKSIVWKTATDEIKNKAVEAADKV